MSAGQTVFYFEQCIEQHARTDMVMAVIKAGVNPGLLKPLQHKGREAGLARIAGTILGEMLQHPLPQRVGINIKGAENSRQIAAAVFQKFDEHMLNRHLIVRASTGKSGCRIQCFSAMIVEALQ